jgi:hypothetical protein
VAACCCCSSRSSSSPRSASVSHGEIGDERRVKKELEMSVMRKSSVLMVSSRPWMHVERNSIGGDSNGCFFFFFCFIVYFGLFWFRFVSSEGVKKRKATPNEREREAKTGKHKSSKKSGEKQNESKLREESGRWRWGKGGRQMLETQHGGCPPLPLTSLRSHLIAPSIRPN